MHQIVYALVTASTTDQTLLWVADVFGQLVGAAPRAEAVFDYYVTFDDDSTTVAGSARWGDLPVVTPAGSEDGQEFLESGWQAATREFERNLECVREGVDDLDATAIMRDEDPVRHVCHNLGTYRGPAAYLYDEFVNGVRHRKRLEQLVGSNDHLWIVPADVHYWLWRLWSMVFLRETLLDRGIAARIVIDDVADTYRVEYTPLSGGVVTDERTVFGGSISYDASVFSTAAAVHAFVERVQTTSHDDVLAE